METLFCNGPVRAMLAAFAQVLQRSGIDFFLVGATARDIRLSADPAYAPKRATKDVDIAIMLASQEQFYQVKEALLATGDFTAHDDLTIKLYYKQSIEIDLLPFGEIENERRETRIEKPRPFTMDMPGFREVLPYAGTVDLDGLTLRVCSLEGIVLLKIISHDDNPARTKDLIDIDHIINAYFDLETEKIFADFPDVADLYETNDRYFLQKISGRVIGREIGRFLQGSPGLTDRVKQIVNTRMQGIYWSEISIGIEEGQGT